MVGNVAEERRGGCQWWRRGGGGWLEQAYSEVLRKESQFQVYPGLELVQTSNSYENKTRNALRVSTPVVWLDNFRVRKKIIGAELRPLIGESG